MTTLSRHWFLQQPPLLLLGACPQISAPRLLPRGNGLQFPITVSKGPPAQTPSSLCRGKSLPPDAETISSLSGVSGFEEPGPSLPHSHCPLLPVLATGGSTVCPPVGMLCPCTHRCLRVRALDLWQEAGKGPGTAGKGPRPWEPSCRHPSAPIWEATAPRLFHLCPFVCLLCLPPSSNMSFSQPTEAPSDGAAVLKTDAARGGRAHTCSGHSHGHRAAAWEPVRTPRGRATSAPQQRPTSQFAFLCPTPT